jgi:phospholipase C
MTKNTARGPFRRLADGLAKGLNAQTLIRCLGMPFQRLLDHVGATHEFLTEQGFRILENDGWREAAKFCRNHRLAIVDGNYWADTFWKNATHHLNPRTKRGLWVWPAANDQLRNWFNLAVSLWVRGKIEKAAHALGSCLHIVQDCCQPYHSNCVIFGGHQKYEVWADAHKQEFPVERGGIYRFSGKPEDWAKDNAEFSSSFLSEVACQLPDEEDRRRAATGVLLGRAQRTTAGFIMFFLDRVRAASLARQCPQKDLSFLEALLTRQGNDL